MVKESVIAAACCPSWKPAAQALKKGVGRVRILPAAQAEVLPQFYFTKLECGTEVLGA